MAGRVVGINTLILSRGGGSEGLGFAAPCNMVKNGCDPIRRTGRVRRGEIGAVTQTLTPALAAGLGLPRLDGVLVSDVAAGSGAARAGIELGDVIVAMDGKPMENARQLSVNLYRHAPGETVTLEVMRGPARRSLIVPVSERARDPEGLRARISPEGNVVPRLGLLALDLDAEVAAMIPPARAQAGVVVAAATEDGPRWAEPPEPGDVIYAVNGRLVRQVGELRAAVEAMKPGDAVVLQVERQGRLVYLSAELE
jgi:serine protease Do